MARTQAVNQQRKAVAASNAPAPKKNKIVETAAADRENAAEKEIDAGKDIVAGKEIGTVTEIAAETDIFPETDITLAKFFEDTDFAAKTVTTADIPAVAEITTEKDGSSCSNGAKTYNLRVRPEKRTFLDGSDTDGEDEDKDENDDDSRR